MFYLIAPPFIASIAKIMSPYKIDVGTPIILSTFHQAGRREITREGKVSSIKIYYEVIALTISAKSHWQGICLIFGGPNLTLKKTRRITLLRDNCLSATADIFKKFHCEGEVRIWS